MPHARFALILAPVILAAGLTIWAAAPGLAGAAPWLLPVVMGAALALRRRPGRR